jgi:Secretion system C-terminal sorting domain/Outer membrane protein Omp28
MKIKFIVLICVVMMLGLSLDANSQAVRKVLFEEWTSSTCGPCASNNPVLNAFIEGHIDTITAVKYHVGWPVPGNDPMYLHNPTESYDRRYYYGVNAVPWLTVDGVLNDIWPFTIANFQNAMTTRLGVATPLAVTVTDLRIPGDSNKATVVVNILSNLPAGSYYLRVMAVEKKVIYTSPPGTNGETIFPEVFRKSFPNSLGTSLPVTAGTYTYEFRYKIHPVWVDSMIYTIAFVQNDANKECLNSFKAIDNITGSPVNTEVIPESYSLSQNYPNPFNPSTNIKFTLPEDGTVSLRVYSMIGAEVKTLVEGNHKRGEYNIYFDGSELSSGVYFYTLRADKFTETKKMILVK